MQPKNSLRRKKSSGEEGRKTGKREETTRSFTNEEAGGISARGADLLPREREERGGIINHPYNVPLSVELGQGIFLSPAACTGALALL